MSLLRALILACLLPTVASVEAATRVALVSTCGGSAGADVLALAEARLSADKEIALLERAMVERVVNEQKLTTCGLTDSKQALAVGKLLGVEVFVALETFPDSKTALGLVAFDAGNGIKLWDAALPDNINLDQLADGIAAAVRAACEKRQQIAGGVRTVCLLAVRNADLPREMDNLCWSVGSLVERQLVRSPAIATLERKRLVLVNAERDLPTTESAKQLLASLLTIDLELRRSTEDKGIAAKAVLMDGAGKPQTNVECSVEGEGAADLAGALAQQILRALAAVPGAGTADRVAEAQRFLQEAKFLTGHQEWMDGIRAIESSAALDPTNQAIQTALLEFLRRGGPELVSAKQIDFEGAVDLSVRAHQLATVHYLEALARHEIFVVSNLVFAPWVPSFTYSLRSDPRLLDRYNNLKKSHRDLALRLLNPALRAQAEETHDPSYFYFSHQSYIDHDFFDNFEPSSSSWMADVRSVTFDWLNLAKDYPVSLESSEAFMILLFRLVYHTQDPPKGWSLDLTPWQFGESDFQELLKLYQTLRQHPDPLVQTYGMMGEFGYQFRKPSVSAGELAAGYEDLKRHIREAIASPGREPFNDYRSYFYQAAIDLIDLMPDPAFRRREYLDLFQFMLDRKEVEYWVVKMVVDPEVTTFQHYHYRSYNFKRQPVGWSTNDFPKSLENVELTQQLLRSTDVTDLDTRASWAAGGPGLMDPALSRYRRRILDVRPELAQKPTVPWEQATIMFDVSRVPDVQKIEELIPDGNDVYILTASSTNHAGFLQLFRLSLDDPRPILISKAPISAGTLGWDIYVPTFKKACLGSREVFAASHKGIFVFPLDGGSVRQITKDDGLPTDEVQSVAYLNGKLYAALGDARREAFLVDYDLERRTCTILASSRRKEKQSELDDFSLPFSIKTMMADPARNRVVFVVDFGPNVACVPPLGVWQIDAQGRVTQLYEFYDYPWWCGTTPDGVLIAVSTGNWASCKRLRSGMLFFNPANDRIQILVASDNNPVGPKIPGTEQAIRPPALINSPYWVLDGWLWFAGRNKVDSGRVSFDGKIREYFPVPDSIDPADHLAWDQFQFLGVRRRILASNGRSVWLLTLPAVEAKGSL